MENENKQKLKTLLHTSNGEREVSIGMPQNRRYKIVMSHMTFYPAEC